MTTSEPTRDFSTPPRCSLLPSSDPCEALRLFASVGVTAFDESTICDGRRDYVRGLPLALLLETIRERMEVQLYGSPYILRPLQPEGVALIQLDDIVNASRVAELAKVAFITYQTSAAKFQAWLAVRVAATDDCSALRRSLIRHYGSDPNASGASRWPGSLNEKYRPAYQVRITHGAPGRLLRVTDLPVTLAPSRPVTAPPRPRMTGLLPDYQRELERTGNANQADWSFSLKALSSSRGCTPAQVIEALMQHSPTAKTRPRMIAYTVTRAGKVAR